MVITNTNTKKKMEFLSHFIPLDIQQTSFPIPSATNATAVVATTITTTITFTSTILTGFDWFTLLNRIAFTIHKTSVLPAGTQASFLC